MSEISTPHPAYQAALDRQQRVDARRRSFRSRCLESVSGVIVVPELRK